MKVSEFLTVLQEYVVWLQMQDWNPKSTAVKQVEFELNVADEMNLKIKLVYLDGQYYYMINIGRLSQESLMRERASQMEFMTQLISSLGHELNTPLMEITKKIEMLDVKLKGSGYASPERSRKGFVFGSGRTTDDKLSLGVSATSPHETQSGSTSAEFRSRMRNSETKLDQKVEKLLDFVYQTSMKMTYLIGSLLTYSQILNGQNPISSTTEFQVATLLEEVVTLFHQKCSKKELSIKVVCDPEIKVKTDRKRLIGCLCLFVDNAVKFTNEVGERIFLCAELSEQKTQVIFKVIDLGNGINKRDMAIITRIMTNPFSTTVTSSSAGLGIGLRMAECIISELSSSSGRCLEIHSKLQSGTTVSFQIPASQPLNVNTPRTVLKANNFSVAGLVGIALLKPKLTQLQERHELYETEREQLLGAVAVLDSIPDEERSTKMNLTKNLSQSAGLEEANFKQSNQIVSSLLVPVGRGVIPNANRLRRASINSNRMLNSLTGSKILSSIVMTRETKKVMIVDDEVFLLEFLRDVLEDRGLEVFTASGPERAFDLSALLGQMGKKIDMVYMDFNMPGMNGADCVAILKSDQYLSSMESAHFTAVTAQDDQKVRGLFEKVGG